MKTSNFQFKNPELDSLKFKINENFSGEENIALLINAKVEVKRTEGKTAYVSLSVRIGGTGTDQPFEINVKMSSEFFWIEDIDEEMLKVMLNANAPAVLMSYIRPLVSTVTSDCKYPTVKIPFVDFTQIEDVEYIK